MPTRDDRAKAAKAALERKPERGKADVVACDFCAGPVLALELGDKHEVHCGRCKTSYECDARGERVGGGDDD